MAIFADRKLKVGDDRTVMDQDIILYRGDKNIYVYFTLSNLTFGFKNLLSTYESDYPTHAYITLITPLFTELNLGKKEISNNCIELYLTKEMMDEVTEVGDYTIIIGLYDEMEDSLLTLPPIVNQLHIREKLSVE